MPPKRKKDEVDAEEEAAAKTTKAKATKGKAKVTKDEEEAEEEEEEEVPKKQTKAKPKAAAAAAAAAAPSEAKQKAAKRAKTKPLTAEEEKMVAGASMERNQAIIDFFLDMQQHYVEEKTWFKVNAVKKVVAHLKSLTEPVEKPRDLMDVAGFGKGSLEKLTEFLLSYSAPGASAAVAVAAGGGGEGGYDFTGAGGGSSSSGGGSSSSAVAAGASSASKPSPQKKGDPDFEWVLSSDRDVILALLRNNELTLEKVAGWRSDITQADLTKEE